MPDDPIGNALNILWLDLFSLESSFPSLFIAQRPLSINAYARLRGEVGSCDSALDALRIRGDTPVRDRLWPGRSLRGVTTGVPILEMSTLCMGPMFDWPTPAETEERRERDCGWWREGVR